MDRYNNYEARLNSNPIYNFYFQSRGVNNIKHHPTQYLRYPTDSELSTITSDTIYWSREDRLWQLAEKYYSNPSYWWVIAFFNKKPTEAHFQIGDVVFIPTSLTQILNIIKG
jgi:hypothetical protein